MNKTTYRAEYCEQLIDHMAKGKSFESFGGKIRVGRQTLYDWTNAHSEFMEAKSIGQMSALDYLETRLTAKISGQKFSDKNFNPKDIDTAMTIFALKTRFHKIYGEKKDVELSGNIGISIDSDDSEL
jgi:hypothetical protein